MSESGSKESIPLTQRLHGPAMARAILLIAVCLTAAAWFASRQATRNTAEQRFEFRTQELEGAIQDRMLVYEQVLWGGVGLFNASENVSREEWAEYVAAINLEERWPGMQGMGYAIPIEPEDLEDHISQIRDEGFPDYNVNPPEPRDSYTSIIYLEPFDERNQNAFGFDMWSNSERRVTMARARDDAEAATSGAVTLVQEIDEDVQRGFLTYLPVYDTLQPPTTTTARQDAFVGWVYAPFRMGDLMADIHGADLAALDDVTFEIFDGLDPSDEALLYDSNDTYTGVAGPADADFVTSRTVEFQGHQWTITYATGPNFVAPSESRQPLLIALAGLLFNGALFYVISSLERSNRRVKLAQVELQEQSDELEAYTRQLEESNADLAQFAYVASHDLQEPLRNLGSYSNLLATKYSGELGEEGDRWLGYISNSSGRMSKLLSDLLSYASVGANPDTTEPVDLEAVLDVVLFDLNHAIEEANVEILRDRLPTVTGEEARLRQLLQNLIGNAIKYRSEDRDHKVWISLSETEEDWRITIRDNGIGIKPEYHERVFEVFRRVGPRSKYNGTGIGLAICRKVVASHGGTIGVNSTPGQGTAFWFTLPRTHVPLRLAQERSAELAKAQQPPPLEPATLSQK